MSNYNSLFFNINLSRCILKISYNSHKAVFLLKKKENKKTEKSSYSPLTMPIVKIWLFIPHSHNLFPSTGELQGDSRQDEGVLKDYRKSKRSRFVPDTETA